MSVVCTASEDLAWVHGLQSVLSPEATWRPVIGAPDDCEERGGCSCCDMDDCRCTAERERR